MRVLVVGASTNAVCGVRDCAGALEGPLRAAGVETTTIWLDDAGQIADAVRDAAEQSDVDRILWHYSPFSYGQRGIPTYVPRVAAALRDVGVPVVAFLHELAPDFRGRGWRGMAQAGAQRAALVPLLRAVDGAIVTSAERVTRLQRAWLPRRPVEFIPLISHVPPLATNGHASNGSLRVGVFGFRHPALASDLVTRSVGSLGSRAKLVLVGAPGAEGEAAVPWREAARRHGTSIEFTGILDVAELSHTLASLDILVSPDPAGPAPRRSTLAAALAHGRPVLALDGPLAWKQMRSEGAVMVAGDHDFAERLARLAGDAELRRAQGERGRAFYERWMAPTVVAVRIRDFLERMGP